MELCPWTFVGYLVNLNLCCQFTGMAIAFVLSQVRRIVSLTPKQGGRMNAKWIFAFSVLVSLGAISAKAQSSPNYQSCRTYSQGYTFDSSDRDFARQQVLDQCYRNPHTVNRECDQNLVCSTYGGGGGGGAGDPSDYRTVGVVYRGLSGNENYFEVYGHYPNANDGWRNWTSSVVCNGYLVNSRISYESYLQINVAFYLPYNGATCYVQLYDRNGRSTNNFGPMQPSWVGQKWENL